MKLNRTSLLIASLAPLLLMGSAAHAAHWQEPGTGSVFTMTNAADGNKVLMFTRNAAGELSLKGEFATHGLGSGSGLGSQGSLVLSEDGDWLFAVNAGSNTITAFNVTSDSLHYSQMIGSGGVKPTSLTTHGSLLYVLNAGNDMIAGFNRDWYGHLAAIPGSKQLLSATGVGAAEIQFNPWGDVLAVTEKATNMIDTYHLDAKGRAGVPMVTASIGVTPFGFSFDRRGDLIVAEAVGGAAGASTVSSYDVSQFGKPAVVTAAIPTNQTAACWLVTSADGRFAYTTDTPAHTITAFEVGHFGALKALNSDGIAVQTPEGTTPTDMAFSADNHYLYAVSAKTGTIFAYKRNYNGSLEAMPVTTGLVETLSGLAGF